MAMLLAFYKIPLFLFFIYELYNTFYFQDFVFPSLILVTNISGLFYTALLNLQNTVHTVQEINKRLFFLKQVTTVAFSFLPSHPNREGDGKST